MPRWPEWWSWELELSPHVVKRMTDRRFNETDLRAMLAAAADYDEDREPGRYVIRTRWDARPWEVIVEPAAGEQLLVVITAYPVG